MADLQGGQLLQGSTWDAPDSAVGASSLVYVLCCGPKCASELYRRIKKEFIIEVRVVGACLREVSFLPEVRVR